MSIDEAELDRLYALPLEEFTPARNDLAKRLRADGDRAAADEAKALRKPSVVAWAVNQLARERELDVQRLIRAGERLEQAQTEAVLGSDGGEFDEARRDERDALERLSAAARSVLEGGGHASSDATVDKVVRTLRTAAVSGEGRELLRSGRLTEEIEPRGFEAFMGLDVSARPRGRKEAQPKKERKGEPKPEPRVDRRLENARAKLLEARTEARDRARELDRAEKALVAAQDELKRAETEAGRLHKRSEQARARVERLETQVRDLSR